MEMGAPGRRGIVFDDVGADVAALVGDPAELVPAAMRRTSAPSSPSCRSPRFSATTCISPRRRSG